MHYFISYDISNPKRLYKTAKVLKNYGLRIQYSFFQCEINHDQLAELEQKILDIIDIKEDSLIVLPLCADCFTPYSIIGSGTVFVPQEYQIL